MDTVVATFSDRAEAVSAASALTSELHLDPDLVTLSAADAMGCRPAPAMRTDVVLVAWIAERDRPSARDLLWRHHGRHVPFDCVVDGSGGAAPAP